MYALSEAIAGFRRAPVLTGLSAAMVGLALYVIGLFGLATFNLRQALASIEERVEIAVYLRDDIRQAEIDLAQEELGAQEGVRAVRYISKRDALDRARADLPEFGEIFTDLSVNPLPQSLELELEPGSRTPEVVERIAEAALRYPFVEDARYGEEWVDTLFLLRRIGVGATVVLGAAFGLVAALIIGAALRIAVFARRDEVYVMRLVGATNGFIRRPFLLEGMFAGLLGGVFAWVATYLTFRGVSASIFPISWIPSSWIASGVGGAVIFGALASALAIRRHLRDV